MQRSSIYTKCPGCGDTTLIQELRGTYACAGCGFDYVARFARDEAALEAWAADTMRSGVAGQLAVLYLHPRITGVPAASSVERVKAIAARHGITLPTGAPASPGKIAGAVIGLLALGLAIAFIASR